MATSICRCVSLLQATMLVLTSLGKRIAFYAAVLSQACSMVEQARHRSCTVQDLLVSAQAQARLPAHLLHHFGSQVHSTGPWVGSQGLCHLGHLFRRGRCCSCGLAQCCAAPTTQPAFTSAIRCSSRCVSWLVSTRRVEQQCDAAAAAVANCRAASLQAIVSSRTDVCSCDGCEQETI